MQAFIVLLLCQAVPSDTPKVAEVPKELAKLEGVWKVTAMESRGTESPLARFGATERYTLVIVGDNYVFSTHGGSVKLDAKKNTMDLEVKDGRYKGVTMLGTFEVTGDTLRLALPRPAMGNERPKELKTGADTTHTLYTFERDKATKEQAAAKLKELKATLAAPLEGRGFTTGTASSTQQMLQQIIERLDRIEKRLDAMEKKGNPPDKK